MPDKEKVKIPENIGIANPYALTEVLLKKRVNWKQVTNPQKLVEKTLGMSYDKLFDARNDSPLFAGLKYNAETSTMVRAEVPKTASAAFRAAIDVGGVAANDPGDFFEDRTELTDPVQGALGDCYFIAALSSVAWARPYAIAQKTRATGDPDNSDKLFVDMIEFYKTPPGTWQKVEVDEKILMNQVGSSFNYIYARSVDPGEIWPAAYEKAYVAFRTGVNPPTQAAYGSIAGGDPVAAMRQLIGLTPYYYGNPSMTAAQIWSTILGNSISLKTINPMVAWTYPSSPAGINYTTAHIVGNHAYSLLGYQVSGGQQYVILRNPWGTYEATLNVFNGLWVAWDTPYPGGPGFWRTVNTATSDGIFALRLDTFKLAYAGFGVVK
ncbi:MAG: C2 family cysteine protease [candidate division WOR-3 bacterium]|nr:C2 family cysteine protease [candidate division WOR-3 bacterium]